MKQLVTTFDAWLIRFAKTYFSTLTRIALFVMYFYFGILKILGVSPASGIATGFAEHMGMGEQAQLLYLAIALFECAIGLFILFPKLTRLTIAMLFVHLLVVCAPLVLYPQAVWLHAFVPTLEGQYIIKNVALIMLALGIIANTDTLATK